MAYIVHPNPGWANKGDCVEFPCSAPNNILFDFAKTQYNLGSRINYGPKFQVIANNTGISPMLKTCEPYRDMNAYICKSGTLGVLMFQSDDADTNDRSMQPIYIGLNGTAMANKLNSMMDQVWDGFYTG